MNIPKRYKYNYINHEALQSYLLDKGIEKTLIDEILNIMSEEIESSIDSERARWLGAAIKDSNNFSTRCFKISTPDADEYKEATFWVKDGIIYDHLGISGNYLGKDWEETRSNFISVWKLYSSKYKDNVYPTIEMIPDRTA